MNQRGQIQVLILAGIVILIAVAGGIFFLGRVTAPKPQSQNVATSSPQPSPTPDASREPNGSAETVYTESDRSANWKTYEGKYFSFRYPSEWTDSTGPAATYSENLEVIGLRISPNAVFEASYRNYSYEKSMQQFADRRSVRFALAEKKAMRFELDGTGSVLPKGYSIIIIVVEGLDNTSYTITFNGDRKDITESLIDQILSTFRFD